MGCSVSTALRRAGSKTARLGCSWPMPRPRAGTGNFTCPGCGRRMGRGGGRLAGGRGIPVAQCWSRLSQTCPLATGDEVYGSDRKLPASGGAPRANQANERLWAWTEKGPLQVRADRLASQVEGNWCPAQCRDVYGAAVPLREPGKGRRRSGAESRNSRGSWPTTSASARRRRPWRNWSGSRDTRWAIEECFEEAKGQVGLDQYEVRR